jgi:hypothetical protein
MSQSIPAGLAHGREKLEETSTHTHEAHAHMGEVTNRVRDIGTQIAALVKELWLIDTWPESQAAMASIKAARQSAGEAHSVLAETLLMTENEHAMRLLQLARSIAESRGAAAGSFNDIVVTPLGSEVLRPATEPQFAVSRIAKGIHEVVENDKVDGVFLIYAALEALANYQGDAW